MRTCRGLVSDTVLNSQGSSYLWYISMSIMAHKYAHTVHTKMKKICLCVVLSSVLVKAQHPSPVSRVKLGPFGRLKQRELLMDLDKQCLMLPKIPSQELECLWERGFTQAFGAAGLADASSER